MFDVYRLYPVLALALLAGASVWLERVTRVDEPSSTLVQPTGPDFIARDTQLTGFGKDGQRRYVLLAERLIHFPADDFTELEQPRLQMSGDGRDTHVTATHARVSPGGERIDLTGDVKVRRPAAGDDAGLALDSATLTVWPDSHRASTDTAVLLTRGNMRAEGQGMRADNLFGTLELIGEVRVHMPRRGGSPS